MITGARLGARMFGDLHAYRDQIEGRSTVPVHLDDAQTLLF